MKTNCDEKHQCDWVSRIECKYYAECGLIHNGIQTRCDICKHDNGLSYCTNEAAWPENQKP
jgi:hypothetical protein